MYSFEPELTKDYIFSKLKQEEIFEKYLGIKVQTKRHFTNPLRDDKRVTCKFKYYGNTLIFTDFSGWFSGNCIKLVMFLFSLNYHKSLEKIKEDFLLTGSSFISYNVENTNTKVEQEKTKFIIVPRNFSKLDATYWSSYKISSKTLELFNVKAVKYLSIKGSKFKYYYNFKDPAYVYFFTNDDVKIYFPNRQQFRFLSNTDLIQGYNQLPDKGDVLIITKSLKDVMCLYELGYNAIAFQNEIVIPKKEIIDELKTRFKKIFLFYDFDLTGIRTTNKIIKQYEIDFIFLTNGKFGTIDYGAKDISDYVKIKGLKNTKKLIKIAEINLA